MRKTKLWEDVEALVKEGRVPSIVFPKGAKVVTPPAPVGRPRRKPVGSPKYHGWRLRTPGGCAMRCRAPKCRNFLRRDTDRIVCSDKCEMILREACEIILRILNKEAPVEDLPPFLRVKRDLR